MNLISYFFFKLGSVVRKDSRFGQLQCTLLDMGENFMTVERRRREIEKLLSLLTLMLVQEVYNFMHNKLSWHICKNARGYANV